MTNSDILIQLLAKHYAEQLQDFHLALKMDFCDPCRATEAARRQMS